MKLTVLWSYPNESEIHKTIYHNIDPNKVVIADRRLIININAEELTPFIVSFPLDHVISVINNEED